MFDFAKTLLNGLECFVRGEVGKLRRRIEAVEKAAAKAGKQIKALRADTEAAINNAWTGINSVRSTASAANNVAVTAQSTANAAKTAASNAQSTADTANETANNSVQYVSQSLTESQKKTARGNIGAGTGTSNFSGTFKDLLGMPFGPIPGEEFINFKVGVELVANSKSDPQTATVTYFSSGLSNHSFLIALNAIMLSSDGRTFEYTTYFIHGHRAEDIINVPVHLSSVITNDVKTAATITISETSSSLRASAILMLDGIESVKFTIRLLSGLQTISPLLLPIGSDITGAAGNVQLASTNSVYYFVNSRVQENALMLKSSTTDSTKKFKITVDDEGVISATEITA